MLLKIVWILVVCQHPADEGLVAFVISGVMMLDPRFDLLCFVSYVKSVRFE